MDDVDPVVHPRSSDRAARAARRRRQVAEGATGALFVLPALALVGYFVYLPLSRTIRHSFTNWDGINPTSNVGWGNYHSLLDSSGFRQVILNNLILLSGLLIWVALPMIIAVIASEFKRAHLVRLVMMVPLLMSPVVVGISFRLLLADGGPINATLAKVGLGSLALGWLTNPRVVLFSVIMMIAWATVGTGVLIFASALSAIPPSLMEAARLDGANWGQLLWHIYRPLLRPVTRFWRLLLIIATVTSFFPWIYGLTHGGPGYSSTTLDYFVWTTGVNDDQLGLASAAAVLMLVYLGLIFIVHGIGEKLLPTVRPS